MTSWADVQTAIKAAVVQVAATGAVAWNDEPRPTAKTLIILDLLYVDAIQDREDVTFDADVDDGIQVWTMSTLYYIRLQVRAECVTNAPGHDALFALESVRAGLHRPDLTLPADVVLQFDDQTYTHHMHATADGRVISSYSFEVGFRAVLDYPLTTPPGPVEAPPNMVEVDINTGDVTIDGGDAPAEQLAATITRP